MKNIKKNKYWTTEIKSNYSFFDFNINEIYKFKDLIFLLIKRDFATLYKQTLLGPIWFVIQPLINTLIFTIIFGKLAKISTDEIPDVLFYMSGTILWGYFSLCLMNTSNIFVKFSELFSKVYFPRIVIPISIIVTSFFQFFLQFCVFLAFYFYYKFNGSNISLDYKILFFPLIIFQIILLSIGVGTLISSLTSKYRDFTFILTFSIQLWMFATPVVYPLGVVPDKYKILMNFNPMTSIIESFREIFFGSSSINFSYVMISLSITIFLFLFGILMFNKTQRKFIDTV